MFPVFAAQVLGFVVGQSLAAEVSGTEGRPDFTPADAITHPFVFEVKGTDGGDALAGHTEQVTRYLQQGRNRIKRVVLTNLWGLRVFDLDAADGLREVMHVDLRLLSIIPEAAAVAHPHARALARFLNEFRFQSLTIEQKIERVRTAPPWNPGLEVTQPAWVLARLDSVVEEIRADVAAQVDAGYLLDVTWLPAADRVLVLTELRGRSTSGLGAATPTRMDAPWWTMCQRVRSRRQGSRCSSSLLVPRFTRQRVCCWCGHGRTPGCCRQHCCTTADFII